MKIFTSALAAMMLLPSALCHQGHHDHHHNHAHHHNHDHKELQEFGVSATGERQLTKRVCGTKSLPKDVQAQVEEEMKKYAEGVGKQAIKNAETDVINVKVYWHTFVNSSGQGRLEEATIRKQMEVINLAFSALPSVYDECPNSFTYGRAIETPFRFEMASVDEIEDDEAFDLDSPESDDKRRELRKGTCADMNVFTGQTGSLGFAYLPPGCGSGDTVSNKLDAVMLNYESLPDAAFTGFNEGDTAVHEVGHWLGLDHTFNGGCTAGGDQVADTPPEESAAFGCPIGRDTCSDDQGEDPIHNFMDYTDDCCMYRFTEGQVRRMVTQVGLFRNLVAAPPTPPTPTTTTPPSSPTPPTPTTPTPPTPTTTSPSSSDVPFGGECNFPNDGFDYSNCDAEFPCWIGDEVCDSMPPYNTTACNNDAGDCINTEPPTPCSFPDDGFDYSNCNASVPCWIGDDFCDTGFPYSTDACNNDAGDCAGGDDNNNNTSPCQFPDDGFDYSNCDVDIPCWIGDNFCDSQFMNFNTPNCNMDGGDCGSGGSNSTSPAPSAPCVFPVDGFDYSGCSVDIPCWIGDGVCDNFDNYPNSECNKDGGDCDNVESTPTIAPTPDCRFPDDGFDYSSCMASQLCWIGDGICDRGLIAAAECNFDGGDCLPGQNPPTSPTVPTPTTPTTDRPSAKPSVSQIPTPLVTPDPVTGLINRIVELLNLLLDLILSFLEGARK